ncbi:sensor domain-containing diguanylate cyclase [Butyrivibrio sp. CB08]|uniref:GGDEF domain-containing protein n=1 Tax=Butyrivibrio sp. CB08 TaxID=2364879 RepID=UPI000EA932BD|nr:GGDEF domain-containing protein [Butyrivibrio sp. CB08]RKM59286.1 sensor domain-containing diguanylate cyclase [Butyrivibrio sp. CB08]
MSVNKRPLKKSIFISSAIFFIFLCLVLSILTYTSYTRSLYHAYELRMTDIIEYVESHMDIEDLSNCVDTGVESEKYAELMDFMDSIMDDFDIHFLYIVRPISAETPTVMMNILSADTHLGRQTDPDGLTLNYMIEDGYEPQYLKLYMDAMESEGITFFKDFSDWGYDYTGVKPLINARGEKFALLCVDIEVSDLRSTIREYMIVNVVLIVILGFLFILFFIAWANRNITEPITKLEKSVVSFAERSHEQKDPDKLSYDDPHIMTHNEVESLSNAVAQMSSDMRAYVKSILDAEGQVEDMKSQVIQMDTVAYQDALTHVKNKAWYDKTKARVDEDIINGKAKFAILMIDLNNLKKVNDTYGHEHGDEYISGACHQICIIYSHSPVFRIGGDEFVVLLENQDYDHKDQLLTALRASFEASSIDEDREPWDRYSAATGMAIFDEENDVSMDDVFKRADTLMYQNKLESKMARE